jgi:hypothetical protein
MVSFEQLTKVDPGAWASQANSWNTLSSALESQAQQLTARYQPLHTAWVGRDADAAAAHVEVLRKELLGHADNVSAAASALQRHATDIRTSQLRVAGIMQDAQLRGLTVDPDGTVRSVSFVGALPTEQDVQSIADELGRVVGDATATDERTAAALRPLLAPPGSSADPVMLAADAKPPPGGSPKQVADWWKSLDPHAQEAVLFEHPELIGGLDGIPAQSRDRANQSMLAVRKAEIQHKIDDLNRLLPPDQRADAIAPLLKQQAGIHDIETRLANAAPGQPKAYLLGLDTQGNGHAIVAIGNPDHSNNVVTSVPGTFAELSTTGAEIQKADALVISATLADPTQTTSTIAWVGYDAPQSLIPGAADPTYAQNAEGKLAGFQDGLRANHDGPPSHNTVLGHSYGTTVVGFAARDHGLHADDIAFVGSPGVGVDHAADLHIDPSHVWASRAPNDVIAVAVSPQELLKLDPGPVGFIDRALDPTRHAYYGTDPTDAHFGGQVFHSDLSHLNPINAHGEYWDLRSDSLKNLGRIAVGRTDVSR